jgi:predicted acylesterase/phospholipase RssA
VQEASESSYRVAAAQMWPHSPPPSTPDNALAALRRSGLCRGVDTAALQVIAASLHSLRFGAGETICHQDETARYLFLVSRGKIQLAVRQRRGEFRLLEYLGRGEHFGELSLLTDGRYVATATAVVDSEVLALEREQFHNLLTTVPMFAANISRSLGFQLRWEASGRRRRWRPKLVAIVHSTLQTQMLLRPLAEALCRRDNRVAVLTDRPTGPIADGNYRLERITPRLGGAQRVAFVRERLHKLGEVHDRVLLDIHQQAVGAELPQQLSECEEIFWLAEPRFADSAASALRAVVSADPQLGLRIHWVWTLGARERFAPLLPADLPIASKDFKVVVGDNTPDGLQLRQGVSRLVRHLNGVAVGLALGGGGARGLAHLGVLQAFDERGIHVDMIAGTSSGALVGAAYAAGWPPRQAMRHFRDDLTPRRWWRWLPRRNQWFLWAMFRLGAWDGMLRRYFGEHRLEQLALPLLTVAVDLVEGREVIRERGDAVAAILESINLPLISPAILRDGMVLVDGGILNNVPGDVLLRRGANLVIGVDVVAKLSKRFANNTAGMLTRQMRRPGPIDTLLRISEVQDQGIAAVRRSALDLVIAPDTADFEFADFTKTEELAERGYRAAQESMPQIQQLLGDLEAA